MTSGIGEESVVLKFTPTGAKTVVAQGFSVPTALQLAPDGRLFVADALAGAIVQIAADGTSSRFIDGLAKPSGATCLAGAPDGVLWFFEGETGKLLQAKAAGKTNASTELQGYEIHRICFDAAGNLYATAPRDGLILWRDTAGQVKKFAHGFVAKDAENSGPLGLAIDAEENLYFTHQGQILRTGVGRLKAEGKR